MSIKTSEAFNTTAKEITDEVSTFSPGTTAAPTATVPTGSADPSTATTQAASGSTISGGTNPTGGTTISPGTGSSATLDPTGTTAAPTTTPPIGCDSNPCLGGSTCEDRHQTFVCLCLPGDDYIDNSCKRAKVFPKLLKLLDKYEEAMSDKKTAKFRETADKITKALNDQFSSNAKYSRSVVLELRRSLQSKARSETGKVEASVEIIYDNDAEITTGGVDEELKKVVCNDSEKKCPLEGTAETTPICDKACDLITTTCKDDNGVYNCTCKDGYYPSAFIDRECIACPPGQKYDGETCVNCSPLLTGINCNDNTALILVIVVSIVGALLIIALIVLPIVLSKNKKKKSKKGEDSLEPYYSHSVAKAPVSNGSGFGYGPSVKESAYNLSANTGAPRIPRATHTSNWDKTNLEMTPSNSRQNLIPSGRNSNNPYDHVVQRSNPYGQSGGMNPYSQNRGQTNPYFN
ncbi:PREDICTED: mucin-13-like [Cyprinodon variegatus]|uniref:mucin-13-like n=1 Tax=Cyprinodon variegatus TaxID=28743 RepID=UPI00074287C1|nr:PREDICTED: mucin-13-like [Cyprinodon variegatus]